MSRDKELRAVARDLVYDDFTWSTMSGFNKEEHKLINKYIKEYEREREEGD